jgi:acyl-CoA thioesterase FadM
VEGFPFVHYETARFSDLDGMGHLNNAVYSVYIEQARLCGVLTESVRRTRRRLWA